jgi:tryptophan 7-halogenase
LLSPQALRDSFDGLNQQLSQQLQLIPDHLSFIKGYCAAKAGPDVRIDPGDAAL